MSATIAVDTGDRVLSLRTMPTGRSSLPCVMHSGRRAWFVWVSVTRERSAYFPPRVVAIMAGVIAKAYTKFATSTGTRLAVNIVKQVKEWGMLIGFLP